jgi:hypothetical protein
VWSHRKVASLGLSYTPIEVSIRDCALSLYAKGLLKGVVAPMDGPGAAPGCLAEAHPPGKLRHAGPEKAEGPGVEDAARE